MYSNENISINLCAFALSLSLWIVQEWCVSLVEFGNTFGNTQKKPQSGKGRIFFLEIYVNFYEGGFF
jgi:hypothetical protein